MNCNSDTFSSEFINWVFCKMLNEEYPQFLDGKYLIAFNLSFFFFIRGINMVFCIQTNLTTYV